MWFLAARPVADFSSREALVLLYAGYLRKETWRSLANARAHGLKHKRITLCLMCLFSVLAVDSWTHLGPNHNMLKLTQGSSGQAQGW